MKKLVLLGGGHAHVEVLRQLAGEKPGVAEVLLVNPGRHAPYSGMLPGLIAGHYTFDECHIDLAPLAERASAQWVDARALTLDTAQRALRLDNGSEVAYDLLSIDIGSTPVTGGVPGVNEHAIAVKPVDGFLRAWGALQQAVAQGDVKRIAVVGGGAAGVEVLLAMQHRLTQAFPGAAVRFVLVMDTAQVLPRHPGGARSVCERALRQKGVEVRASVKVTALTHNGLCAQDELIGADAVVWVTGAASATWLADSGLALDAAGFIRMDPTLRSVSHPEVLAAGDCATIDGLRYPKSGVYAVRQGPVLAANLRALLVEAQLLQYTPQPRSLALISTGARHAVASYGAVSFHGNWVWRWKDRIDRQFMARYRML